MSDPKVVLVTGTSRGIGRELARLLAAKGCRVFAGQRSGTGPAGTETLVLDVSDAASVAAAAARVREAAGHLDVLVNNAGILLDEGVPMLEVDEADFRRTLEANTLGPWRVAKAFVPLMGRGGRIVNVSSSGGQLASMGGWVAPSYNTSKTALNAITLQLAAALKGRGIAVNSMCPGWVATDMGGASAPKTPAQGSDTALWLALEAPTSLTGKFLQDRREIPW
ncbi:MAG: SDR family NAD(P)-dependent oxidoreductase [Holophagaceae bacterium]|nr:SDR family NAD(P)-dependent oxidoreductase [Holophagaceae bacterium]